MRFAKNTQHDASKVLRLPRKMTMDTSKALRLPRKLQNASSENVAKVLRLPHKTTFDTLQTRLNVTKRNACHAKRSNETFETYKKHPSCRTYHRHGHIAIARTVADGCERLRTVATVNATSSEHTLNPQTPRVKREPLLRIREKSHRPSHHSGWLIGILLWFKKGHPKTRSYNLLQ